MGLRPLAVPTFSAYSAYCDYLAGF